MIDASARACIETAVEDEIAAALAYAESSQFPEDAELLAHVLHS